jgi:hypothetical protein
MENTNSEEVVLPKKRGRKPGSKNKVKTKRSSKAAPHLGAFAFLEKEIQALSNSLKKATSRAQKEIEKLEKKNSKIIDGIKAKATKSINTWKDRAKDYRKKAMSVGKGKRGRKAKPVEKIVGRPGRPKKSVFKRGGGRRKAGELTKKDIIINYMREQNRPMASGELITALFLQSGERDKKRFSQGIYTTLTQIYKSGELKKDAQGIITLNN